MFPCCCCCCLSISFNRWTSAINTPSASLLLRPNDLNAPSNASGCLLLLNAAAAASSADLAAAACSSDWMGQLADAYAHINCNRRLKIAANQQQQPIDNTHTPFRAEGLQEVMHETHNFIKYHMPMRKAPCTAAAASTAPCYKPLVANPLVTRITDKLPYLC